MMYHFLLLATRGSSVMGKVIIWGRCAHLRYVLKVEGFWYSRFILHYFLFPFHTPISLALHTLYLFLRFLQVLYVDGKLFRLLSALPLLKHDKPGLLYSDIVN